MDKKMRVKIILFFLTVYILNWFICCSQSEESTQIAGEIETIDKAREKEAQELFREVEAEIEQILKFEVDLSHIRQRKNVPIIIDTKVFSRDGKLEFRLFNARGEIIAKDLVTFEDSSMISFYADEPGKLVFRGWEASIQALKVGSNINIESIKPDPTTKGNGVETIYSIENEDSKIFAEIRKENEIIWKSSEGEKKRGEWLVYWEGKNKEGEVVGEGTYFFIIRDDKSSEDMKDFEIK